MSANIEPWERLRDLEPPLGAKRRVLHAVEDELARRDRGGRAIWIVLPVAALALIAVIGWPGGEGPASSQSANPAIAPTGIFDAGVAISKQIAPAPPAAEPEIKPVSPTIRVQKHERVALSLRSAKVTVRGPASLSMDGDDIDVAEGTLEINGKTLVRGAICNARISGRATVRVSSRRVQVSVFAGSAEVLPGSAECTVRRVLDLGSRAKPPTNVGTPAPKTKPKAGQNTAATTPSASTLRLQVEAFRRARSAQGPAAVAAWRAFLARWPDSPLRVEATRLMKRAEQQGATP